MTVTIYRRDGSVAFIADKASNTGEAVEQAVLSRADLNRADLSGANLYGANLSSANLTGANLSSANLSRADLTGADLFGANLSRANLSRADLSGADLNRANLSRADLTGADLSRADLSRAKGVHYATIGPVDGWMVSLTLTSGGLRISAGCRYFSVPEAREHWGDPTRWTKGASPEHGARMLHAVNALLALAVDWPEKLPEVSR